MSLRHLKDSAILDNLESVEEGSLHSHNSAVDSTSDSSETESFRGLLPTEDPTRIKESSSDFVNRLSESLPEPGHFPASSGNRFDLHRSKSEVLANDHQNTSRTSSIFPKSWLGGGRGKTDFSSKEEYTIEYSVFKPIQNLPKIECEADLQRHFYRILQREQQNDGDIRIPDNYVNASQFSNLVSSIAHDVETDPDLKPMRISQGSSGSYFILGKKYNSGPGNVAYTYKIYKRGVFKPKDEEPYGPLSPKWSKWLHRTFFPCFFGRSCLIPNLGYISEAAACVLDRQLLTFIVPYTDIIHLRSDQFYYSFWQKRRHKISYKIGSYQYFLSGYVEAHTFLKQFPFPSNLDDVPDETTKLCHVNDNELPEFFWSKALICQFQNELEKLVILDYLMRNTDRGADNWMIKVEWVEKYSDGISKRMSAGLKIGAIDSGLAFPWKHPDEWRSFPFGWLFLPYFIVGRPFSAMAREHFLPLLTSKYWWEQTTKKLKTVFQRDADFKERMWHKQIAVLKGQAFNVVEILKHKHAGPLELIRRENLLVWDDTMNVPSIVNNSSVFQAMESSIYDVPSSYNSALSETTPLLRHGSRTKVEPLPRNDLSAKESSANGEMSGFDYNLSYRNDNNDSDMNETNGTKTVVIERLEKVSSRRPVFTWC